VFNFLKQFLDTYPSVSINFDMFKDECPNPIEFMEFSFNLAHRHHITVKDLISFLIEYYQTNITAYIPKIFLTKKQFKNSKILEILIRLIERINTDYSASLFYGYKGFIELQKLVLQSYSSTVNFQLFSKVYSSLFSGRNQFFDFNQIMEIREISLERKLRLITQVIFDNPNLDRDFFNYDQLLMKKESNITSKNLDAFFNLIQVSEHYQDFWFIYEYFFKGIFWPDYKHSFLSPFWKNKGRSLFLSLINAEHFPLLNQIVQFLNTEVQFIQDIHENESVCNKLNERFPNSTEKLQLFLINHVIMIADRVENFTKQYIFLIDYEQKHFQNLDHTAENSLQGDRIKNLISFIEQLISQNPEESYMNLLDKALLNILLGNLNEARLKVNLCEERLKRDKDKDKINRFIIEESSFHSHFFEDTEHEIGFINEMILIEESLKNNSGLKFSKD
jgi:hypothetical protein